jgi:hypothetical protein
MRWFKMTNPFPFPIRYEDAGMRDGKRCIALTKPLVALTSLGYIEAKVRFISDGCSIPKPLWSILGCPFDDYLEESVIHDWLYSENNHDFTRAEADFVFKELMWNCGINKAKIAAFYIGLRIGGRKNYKGQPQ